MCTVHYENMQLSMTPLHMTEQHSSFCCLFIQVNCASHTKRPCRLHICLIAWWSLPLHLSHYSLLFTLHHLAHSRPHSHTHWKCAHTNTHTLRESRTPFHSHITACSMHDHPTHYLNAEIIWVSGVSSRGRDYSPCRRHVLWWEC